VTTLLIGDVWGQQPNKPAPPPPAPLLPAEQAWLRELPEVAAADGAMDGERVYVPLQSGGTIALERETGNTAWTNRAGTPWPLLLAPSLVVAVNTMEVVGIARQTGDTAWRIPLPSASVARGIAAAGLVLVPLENGAIVALQAADGMTAWTCRLEDLAAPVSLTADEGSVYVTAGNSRVAAVALASGQLRWDRTLAGTLSPPAAGKNRVFVGSTSNAFFALDAATGRIEWDWKPQMIGGDILGSAVDGDLTFFIGLDNLLHAVNRGNGNQRWKQPTPMRPIAPPVAFGGIVAVFGISPAVATFNAKTGAAIATYSIPSAQGATGASIPKGPLLIDRDLKPFRVAMVGITADGRAVGLRPTGMMFREAPTVPLSELPGRQIQRERLPVTGSTR
jgi:outer membrane protein assembly factor BamB